MTSALHQIVEQSRDLAPSTKSRYLRDLNHWVAFAGDNPANWTRKRANEFYNGLLATMKPQSANRLMSSLAYASRWWAHFENRPELDFARVQSAKAGAKLERRTLTDEQALKLLQACLGPSPLDKRDLAMLVVGLETGMRRMSLVSMEIQSTMLAFKGAKYPTTQVNLKGRGDERTSVPLSDTAILALKPWLSWLSQMGVTTGPVFQPVVWGLNQSGLRVPSPMKRQLSFSAIEQILIQRSAAAAIPHVNPHMLRHTFITWRTIAGHQPHEVASMTGHAIKGIGALGGYMDMYAIGGLVRNATPTWLVQFIEQRHTS